MHQATGDKKPIIDAALEEAANQARLNASGFTVPLLGVCQGETKKGPYLRMIMPLGEPAYPGSSDHSLLGVVNRTSGYNVSERLGFAMVAARAVEAVHAAGITHRDVKPNNFILFRNDTGGLSPRLGDFGQARLRDAALTSGSRFTGKPWGTLEWAARKFLPDAPARCTRILTLIPFPPPKHPIQNSRGAGGQGCHASLGRVEPGPCCFFAAVL